MKIAFRLECPACHWGHEWRDDYVNQGWLELVCSHCEKSFFVKITIPSIAVEVCLDRPEAPVAALEKE